MQFSTTHSPFNTNTAVYASQIMYIMLCVCFMCRRDIAMVNEQLATQHAKVLRLEQSETTTQDQLLAEKIAEKQLKIKQVSRCLIWTYYH